MLTCQESCYYNDAHDELGLNPQNFVRKRIIKEHNIAVDTINADYVTKVYVVRKDHRLMTRSEFESLPESMKAIRYAMKTN